MRTLFSLSWKQAFHHVFEKEGVSCEANPTMRLSIPAAMRAKGYSDVEAADQILVQQVRRESQKKAPKDNPRPESAASSRYWPW